MLDEAIFTTPPHPRWSGAALLDSVGALVGVGSLFVQDAKPDQSSSPGNMFIPIQLLKTIIDDLVTYGKNPAPPRPWLGIYSMEALGRVLVTSVAGEGPAEGAGVEPGDVILYNNSYTGTPHLPEFCMVRPVFVDGELAGFVAVVAHQPLSSVGPARPWSMGSGLSTVLANVAFLAALNRGLLSISSVLSCLHPAVTVLLARLLLHERMSPTQATGLFVAVAAISMITAS